MCLKIAYRALASPLLATAVLLTAASRADGDMQADTKPAAGSLDQQLLEGLDRDLLEGLPQPASPATPRGKAPAEAPPAGEDLGAPGESQNPLAAIAAKMRAVESRIAAGDTSDQTQAEQKQILAQLAALLEQAQKQGAGQQPGGQGSGQASQQAGDGGGQFVPGPVQDSTNRIERGTPEQAETTDVKDLLSRIWGHLPDKMRSEMQASLSEQFLPKYERLIEQYYKRLAEERPGGP